MKPTAMHSLAHKGCHTCAPKPWRHVPNVTGDYDLDATMMHRSNKDIPARVKLHLRAPKTDGGHYGTRSAYNGYAGNHGDE